MIIHEALDIFDGLENVPQETIQNSAMKAALSAFRYLEKEKK